MFKITFKDSKFKNLEPGEYIGIIVGGERELAKDKVTFTFQISIDNTIHKSRKFIIDGKDENFYIKKVFNSLDIKVNHDDDLDALTQKARGIKAEIKVSPREYNGKIYNDVEIIRALGRATEEELSLVEVPF